MSSIRSASSPILTRSLHLRIRFGGRGRSRNSVAVAGVKTQFVRRGIGFRRGLKKDSTFAEQAPADGDGGAIELLSPEYRRNLFVADYKISREGRYAIHRVLNQSNKVSNLTSHPLRSYISCRQVAKSMSRLLDPILDLL